MQQSADKRRVVLRAALVLAAGLGPGAVLPAVAVAATYVDPARAVAEDRAAIQRLVVAEAVRNGVVPAPLALAVVDVESGFVPRTLGTSGAIGLMQLLPATAKREFGVDADALWEPAANVRLGLRRLARLHDRYGGDWELALSHFRGGELRNEGGIHFAHDYTRGYVERVIRCWRGYQRDLLVRAWIREASGAPRFVAGETLPHYRDWVTTGIGSPTGHGRRSAGIGRRTRSRRPTAIAGAATASPIGARRRAWRAGRPGAASTGGAADGGRQSRGGPPPRFRFRDGPWEAVTGGPRFR